MGTILCLTLRRKLVHLLLSYIYVLRGYPIACSWFIRLTIYSMLDRYLTSIVFDLTAKWSIADLP